MSLDEAARARVAPYVSSLTDPVFTLAGLPEEAVTVLFAHYARTEPDLRAALARLVASGELGLSSGALAPKAEAFHATWSGAALADHASIHLGIEGVSVIACRAIEDLRLAKYSEKSTAFAAIDRASFVVPKELGGEHLARYRASAERLLDAYVDLLPRVTASLSASAAPAPDASPADHLARSRERAAELLRGLLPSGTRTSLGLTANLRALTSLVGKMLAHPLAEVRAIAASMQKAALHVAPTLAQAAWPNAYHAGVADAVGQALRRVYTPPVDGGSATMVVSQPVRLVRHDKDALERIALALTYDGIDPRAHAYGLVDGLRHATAGELEGIVRAAFAGRGPRDAPPRGLEASSMTFELMLDYGAYRHLQRHRMVSPATQRLTCRLGFETPSELVDAGHADAFQDTMIAAYEAWSAIEATHPLEAQYAVPLGYRIRTLWTLNLRELFHVIELRSVRDGHPSFRRIAQGLYRTACGVHPWLRDLIRVDLSARA